MRTGQPPHSAGRAAGVVRAASAALAAARGAGVALLAVAAAVTTTSAAAGPSAVPLPPPSVKAPVAAPLETRRNLKVAIVGDHGVGRDAAAVLRLIKAEGADLVLSLGDLGYEGGPARFAALLDATLGPDLPFFAALGNHDADEWTRYHALLTARAARAGTAHCEGVLGVRAACEFDGLFFVTAAVEVLPGEGGGVQAAYLAEKLAQTPSRWRICAWHFNQNAMQLGSKPDQAGWAVYEACRRGGALIATAHEHSYARSHAITRFADPPDFERGDGPVTLAPGRTIAIVSGLGGHSVRPQRRGGDWWATAFTASQGARPGALLCTFNPDGDAARARCAFKTIDGRVADRFELLAPAGR